MSLSQLARSIRESATLKLNETAALLREKGEPIIHLGGGEPKSKAPIDAVINWLRVFSGCGVSDGVYVGVSVGVSVTV